MRIDAEQEAISRLLSREAAKCKGLETQICRLEDFKFPPDVDLINASFSLKINWEKRRYIR